MVQINLFTNYQRKISEKVVEQNNKTDYDYDEISYSASSLTFDIHQEFIPLS